LPDISQIDDLSLRDHLVAQQRPASGVARGCWHDFYEGCMSPRNALTY
jgi:hypothetical protein